jgi:16S rRNA (cytosine1402-N4)-methyltransferase
MLFEHKSVLLNESIEGLNIKQTGVYVDCTLGGGGHSLKICEKLMDTGILVGIDQDINAITKAKLILNDHVHKIRVAHDNFSNINSILHKFKFTKVDGILIDLGVSSHQLDETSRGFSYMNDSKLDMRMDESKEFSAYDVVNEYSENQLTKIMYEYGEERWAKRIAQFIVSEREISPIETTFELVSVIKKAVPKSARSDGPHPAKRTFQAIRIEVNEELEILKNTIETLVDSLEVNGRLCIISFHSLEDRIVKETFRLLENPCICPRDFPICMCNKKKKVKIITRKPIIPTSVEIEENRRSRSAKLRIIEKL